MRACGVRVDFQEHGALGICQVACLHLHVWTTYLLRSIIHCERAYRAESPATRSALYHIRKPPACIQDANINRKRPCMYTLLAAGKKGMHRPVQGMRTPIGALKIATKIIDLNSRVPFQAKISSLYLVY